MLVRRCFGLALAVGLAASLVACGGSDSSSTGQETPGPGTSTGGTGTGTGGSGGSATTAGAGGTAAGGAATGGSTGAGTPSDGMGVPPPAPTNGMPAEMGKTNIQAVSALYLGDTDRMGNSDSMAWADIGFDLDGVTFTDGKQGGHCQPQAGVKSAGQIVVDGNHGIDNSFGKNIVNGLLTGFISTPSQSVTDAVSGGSFSLLLKLNGVGSGSDYTGLTTDVFAAKGEPDPNNMGKTIAPSDWSMYQWQPYPAILQNPMDMPANYKSTIEFTSSYMTGNTWVSGGQQDITLTLSLSGNDISITIHNALSAVTLSSDHTSGSNGTIGGILQTEEFVTELKKVIGQVAGSAACGSTFDAIKGQIYAASDIMHNGMQDPSQVCDGISIGIGFDTKASGIGTVAPAPAPSPDPCAGM